MALVSRCRCGCGSLLATPSLRGLAPGHKPRTNRAKAQATYASLRRSRLLSVNRLKALGLMGRAARNMDAVARHSVQGEPLWNRKKRFDRYSERMYFGRRVPVEELGVGDLAREQRRDGATCQIQTLQSLDATWADWGGDSPKRVTDLPAEGGFPEEFLQERVAASLLALPREHSEYLLVQRVLAGSRLVAADRERLVGLYRDTQADHLRRATQESDQTSLGGGIGGGGRKRGKGRGMHGAAPHTTGRKRFEGRKQRLDKTRRRLAMKGSR